MFQTSTPTTWYHTEVLLLVLNQSNEIYFVALPRIPIRNKYREFYFLNRSYRGSTRNLLIQSRHCKPFGGLLLVVWYPNENEDVYCFTFILIPHSWRNGLECVQFTSNNIFFKKTYGSVMV